MSNALYNALNTPNNAPNAPISNDFHNMMQAFRQFQKNFTGDPEQMGQELLRTGKMTQQQYNAICKPAQTLYNLIYGHR